VGLVATVREDDAATSGEETMKCPVCGTYTEVLETRKRSDGATRRRYLCANMHRFTTLERVTNEALYQLHQESIRSRAASSHG
jgi:transcriptional regulator NrdR family protein